MSAGSRINPAAYSLLANLSFVGQIQFQTNRTTRMTTTRQSAALNRLTAISSQGGTGVPSVAFNYYANAANQRTQDRLTDACLSHVIRTALLTIFFALFALCASADQIDELVTNLPDSWQAGAGTIINQPATASLEQMLPHAFHLQWYEYNQADYQILLSRQVNIPRARFPGAFTDPFTVALIQTRQGEKYLCLRYDAFFKGWWSRILPYPPDFSPIVGGDPIINWLELPARRDPQLHLAFVEIVSITNEQHNYSEVQNSKVSDDGGKTWYKLLYNWSAVATVRVIESPGIKMPITFTVGFGRSHYVHTRNETWTDWLVKPGARLLGFFAQKDGKWTLQSSFLEPAEYLSIPNCSAGLQALFQTPLADKQTLADWNRVRDKAQLRAQRHESAVLEK